jgi:tRNA(Ile)-lysidine synthase
MVNFVKMKKMEEGFLEFIRNHGLVQPGQRVLLAVSGGMDSMAMAHLFHLSDFPVALAHCNFSLRGGEAESDQQLVAELGKKLGLPFYHVVFDTIAHANKRGISIQMAARELRYDWLEEIRLQEGYDLVATAHHLDDAIETLFINLARGAGVSGLAGIPVKNGIVVRPLLFASREEIEAFVRENGIAYREDASNAEEKYQRNRIRQRMIPVLRELNPSLTETMRDFFSRMESAGTIYREAVARARTACMDEHEGEARIRISDLLSLGHPTAYLFEWLRDFGFTPGMCREVFAGIGGQPGGKFHSESHLLVRDRDHLIITPLDALPGKEAIRPVMVNPGTSKARIAGLTFSFSTGMQKKGAGITKDPRTLTADLDKLDFPMEIRPWKNGDRLIPFGMKGHKKLSDLLIDHKVPIHEKDRVLVLISSGQIVWVAGIRSDDRYKIDQDTKRYFRATVTG